MERAQEHPAELCGLVAGYPLGPQANHPTTTDHHRLLRQALAPVAGHRAVRSIPLMTFPGFLLLVFAAAAVALVALLLRPAAAHEPQRVPAAGLATMAIVATAALAGSLAL